MLRFEDIVFGPIHSRRLGASLGINVLPANGKLCNFDCIYCECGWNKDGRVERPQLPTAEDVHNALEYKLSELSAAGTAIDSITFSGNGEPTINPQFPAIVDEVVALRDRFYPQTKISVLTNATMIGNDGVFLSLRKIDNPILKIDAPTDEGITLINRPSGSYRLTKVIERMKLFEGDFILQTMFLAGEGFDSADKASLEGWMKIVRELRPREIMVYTIDRETPAKGLRKFGVGEMEALVRPLREEGFNIRISG
ncbi:MAG: radical SAM protein [Bacteroidales bacterium]|nr:radical SAM protein [Bacteroidales bacterium]